MAPLPNVASPAALAALFPTTVAQLKAAADAAKQNALTSLEEIYSVDSATIEHVKKADRIQGAIGVVSTSTWVVQQTYTSKEMRDAAEEVTIDLQKFSIDSFDTNKRLFALCKKVSESGTVTEKEEKYYLDQTLAAYKTMGLELEGEQFDKAVQLQKDLAELDTKFSSNISEDKKSISATKEELSGVPESVIEGLKLEDGKYVVGTDYPTYMPAMDNCSNAETRKRLYRAFNLRGYPANEPILKDVIRKRQELAELVGFSQYSDLVYSTNMAKTTETVEEFQSKLLPGLLQKAEKEFAELRATLPKGVALNDKDQFYPWDARYIVNQYTKNNLQVDEEELKKYFPMEKSFKGLFDIYSKFFELEFTQVPKEEATLWDPSVDVFRVKRVAAGRPEEDLGFLIADCFPREGKYTHACCNGIVPHHTLPDGSWAPAVCIVVCNFPKPTDDKPALFRHDDVVTLFHEFGHAIHYLFGRGKFTGKSGYNVKMDFVETPSQLLEEWMWQPEILQMVGGHYSTGEKIPQALLDAKLKGRHFFAGHFYTRQLSLSRLSLDIHKKEIAKSAEIDFSKIRNSIAAETQPFLVVDEESRHECSFGHLMGYSASYYSYMWAEVYCIDIFNEILKRKGLLDPTVGRDYADHILVKGGSDDPNAFLEAFLGRPANTNSFIEMLGL